MARSRFAWQQRILLLGVALTLTVGFPSNPATAAAERNQDIDNTLAEFDDGILQATKTANFPTSNLLTGDQIGAVQLAPIGELRNMTAVTDIPEAREDAGVVAVGRNIFVIGGTNGTSLTDTVYVSQVDTSTGGLGAWQTDPALPTVQHQASATNSSARRGPAVAAYVAGQDSGFIYVLGGRVVGSGGNQISSVSALMGKVVNGRVESWSEIADLPMTNSNGSIATGVRDAAAYVAQLPNGKAYIYIIGGIRSFVSGGNLINLASLRVDYAEINTSTGELVGNAWTNGGQLTIAGGTGIANTSVVGGNFSDASGQTSPNFYIIGGTINDAGTTATSQIYRVTINSSTGAPSFSQASGPAANATLGGTLYAHAAVQFRGNLYITGGLFNGTTTAQALGSYINNEAKIPYLDTNNTTHFIANSQGLPVQRNSHGMVTVATNFSNPTEAYIYAIGGNADGGGTQKTVYRTKIGDPLATNVTYARDGWYVSQAVPFFYSKAKLKEIYWYTDLPASTNIAIDYRLSNDADCDTLTAASDSTTPWQTLSSTSTAGENKVTQTSQVANCFQYRAKLLNTSSSGTSTPRLLRFGVRIEASGATDMTPTDLDFYTNTDGTAYAFKITIRNENTFLPGEPTLAADFGPDGAGTAPGSFFVDIFVFPPGVSPTGLTIPTAPTSYTEVSYDVLRGEIQAGPNGTGYDFVLPATRSMCDYNTKYDTNNCVLTSLKSIFPSDGTYTVAVVVDGNNDVEERSGAGEAEANNILITSVVVGPGGITPADQTIAIALPLVVKP